MSAALPYYADPPNFGADFWPAYKHLYNPRKVAVMAFKNRPFLKELEKRDGFEGDNYNHSIFFEDPQGGSNNFQVAVAQKQASSQGARMVISRGREYQAIDIVNEQIRASRSDMGSLLRKKKHETDRVINEMMRRIDIAFHGSATGNLASFTGTTSGNNSTSQAIISLDIPQMGIRFSVGQYLQLASTNNTNGTPNTLVNGGGVAQVVSVSRGAQQTTITLNTNLGSAWGTIANGTQYWLLRNGDNIGFSSVNPYGGVAGLESWFPLPFGTTNATLFNRGGQVPTNDNFWGFNRSVDVNRLAGVAYIASAGEKYEQTFQNADSEVYIQGANPSVALVHPLDATRYSTELGNKVRYEDAPADQNAGTRNMLIRGQAGDIKLMSDPQVPPGKFYLLDMSTIWAYHLDAMPHLDESDGRPAARDQNSDSIEIRWRSWHQFICDAPGMNLVGLFG